MWINTLRQQITALRNAPRQQVTCVGRLDSSPWFADVLSHQSCVDANLGMDRTSWECHCYRRKESQDHVRLSSCSLVPFLRVSGAPASNPQRHDAPRHMVFFLCSCAADAVPMSMEVEG
jgi:hypothetical protein